MSDEQKPVETAQDRKYQLMVQKLAFAAIEEQKRARRWKIFFIFLFFLYITPAMLLSLPKDWQKLLKQEAAEDQHTALVRLDGIISSDSKASAEHIIASLKAAFEDEETKGVVLEINSPGGSPVQSAYIYDEILRLREEHEDIPLHVVIGDMAASGGYYVAAAGEQIHVNPSSLVGSIGVRLDSFGAVDFIDKLGIERRLLTAGKYKGLLDPFLPEDPTVNEHLQHTLDQVHKEFIDAVKAGRGERLKDNSDLFTGLVWSGREAVEMGLADDFGSSASVAKDIFEAEDLVEYTSEEPLIERLADQLSVSVADRFYSLFITQGQLR